MYVGVASNASLPTVFPWAQRALLPLQAVPVVRDAEGWWSHPDYLNEPEFVDRETIPEAEYLAYCQARGITTTWTSLEGDDEAKSEHYQESGCADCSFWIPEPPSGEGWFMLAIQDTEDYGPICVWGRPIQANGSIPDNLAASA